MTPQQKARAASIITGLRERERQLETRLAGWEFEALVLLQELAAEPVRVPLTMDEMLALVLPITHDSPTTYLALCYESGPYSVTKLRSAPIALIRAVERHHRIGT